MYSQHDIDTEKVPEEKMWTAVIARTVEEWVSGPARSRHEAEEYLFGDGEDFKFVCRFAGLDPQAFLSKLKRLKNTIAVPPPNPVPILVKQ